MRIIKHKHSIFLGVILLATLGLVVSVIFLERKEVRKYSFSPSPTIVPTPSEYKKISKAGEETTSWQMFSDDKLSYSIKHPDNITIDERQTSNGRITVFIFEEDKVASLPGKVTGLYLADTNKSGIDGFTAFSRSDCGKDCEISYTNTDWVLINNVYGVKNPLPNDVHNYYLTDKNMSGSVLNAYVGGYTDVKEKQVQRKIETFEEMIKTIRFER